MPEFTCVCKSETGSGRVIELFDAKENGRIKMTFHGCAHCRRLYFGTPGSPLTQKHIDRGRPID